MGQQDDPRPGLSRGVSDQAMAGHAGGGGQTRRRFGAGPVQPAPVRPGLAGGVSGEGGPAGAVGVQPVVDGQGQQASAVLTRPVDGQPQQGDGVPAAGQGEGDRAVDAGFQSRGQDGPRGPGPVGGVWRQPGLRAGGAAAGAGQPMRVRASVARVRTAALAASA